MKKIDVAREVLAKNPEAVYSEVKEQMEKAGINANYFSVLKNLLAKKGKPNKTNKPKGKPAPEAPQAQARKARQVKSDPVPSVSLEESLAFVTKAGLAQAKQAVVARQQLLTQYEQLSQEVEKAGGVAAVQSELAREEQMIANFEAMAAAVGKVA